MTTVAQTFARELVRAGVRRVFGLPGGETLDLMEGFRQEGLTFILARHETAAAFMAATSGELTGTPGVCLTTLGPGASNMVTGITHAYLDRCPLLAVSAQLSRDRFPLNPHQAVELRMLFHPITKWNATLTAGNAGHVVQKALRIATTERPGPVYLEVPSDVPREESRPIAAPFPGGDLETRRVMPREFVDGDLSDAVALLRRAKRPVVIVGTGALRQGATGALIAFCEWLGAPVIDVPKAKGVFPEHHALFAGTLEMSGTEPLFHAIDGGDLTVTIGVDAVELDRPWQSHAPVLTFDTIPNTDWLFPSHIELVGPIGAALNTVRQQAVETNSEWTREEIKGLSEEVTSLVTPAADGLTPQQVLSVLRSALPVDATIATDTGAHKNLTGQLWRTDVPRSYLVSNGLSSMGFGFPAALAAKLVCPGRTSVAVVGDGGFAMTLGEIETAARAGIPVLCVVFVDHGLSSIRRNQRRRGYPEYGTGFRPADYAGAARAMGIQAHTVSSLAECRQVFKDAHVLTGPTVVAAMVNPEAFP